ncbi:MAG: hypothetical protein SGJ23_02655 [Alphaproteobacteria bacterium]|nr:hypothetical protein [Alphaproteobacteria bacterium]
MGRVLIACASADAGVAARIVRTLADAGHDVETRQKAPSLKSDKDAFDAAETLVLLWSRRMAGETAMLREAAAAEKRLVLVRLDATRPPLPLRAARAVSLSAARPQSGLKALQALTVGAPAPSRRRNRMNPLPAMDAPTGRDERSTWRGTLLLTVLILGVAWSAYYVVVGKPVDLNAVMAALPV